MGCTGMDDMMGLVRPAEEDEAVGLGWEGVGAAGAENRTSSTPVEDGSVPVRITSRHNLVHLTLVSAFLK